MLDEFGLYSREEPFDPFSVMLFKALQVVAFLFFIALLAIAPEAKDGKIESKAEACELPGECRTRETAPGATQPLG